MRRFAATSLAIAAAVLLLPKAATAQTYFTTSNGIAFTSADHNSVDGIGQPVVDGYVVEMWEAWPTTATSPTFIRDIGKPGLNGAGEVELLPYIGFVDAIINRLYNLVVVAHGSGGEGRSAPFGPLALEGSIFTLPPAAPTGFRIVVPAPGP